jgi:putative membrane protein
MTGDDQLTHSDFPTLKTLLIVWLVALVVSGYHPHDGFTWFLEVVPVIIAMPLLIMTRRKFPLTPLLYVLIFVHGLILMLGGHYTYAEVPLGFWIQDVFDFSRNHYDRIGHFAQGFIPAILAREILLRKTDLRRGKMLFFLVVCICLAFSAFYEFLEWGAAVALESDADAFLGTQGDIWDSHWDMLMATLGAIIAQLSLSGWHDRQLETHITD